MSGQNGYHGRGGQDGRGVRGGGAGDQEGLIPKHGGYRKLKSFQIARLAYDVTVRFCDRYIDKRSRTHDQMWCRRHDQGCRISLKGARHRARRRSSS